eukprot:TCALIF_12874-PA protein Name:"Protein of unknown function" AED:0.76 eAED:1.00 QI:0/0/0/0.25/1/1/4/0/315
MWTKVDQSALEWTTTNHDPPSFSQIVVVETMHTLIESGIVTHGLEARLGLIRVSFFKLKLNAVQVSLSSIRDGLLRMIKNKWSNLIKPDTANEPSKVWNKQSKKKNDLSFLSSLLFPLLFLIFCLFVYQVNGLLHYFRKPTRGKFVLKSIRTNLSRSSPPSPPFAPFVHPLFLTGREESTIGFVSTQIQKKEARKNVGPLEKWENSDSSQLTPMLEAMRARNGYPSTPKKASHQESGSSGFAHSVTKMGPVVVGDDPNGLRERTLSVPRSIVVASMRSLRLEEDSATSHDSIQSSSLVLECEKQSHSRLTSFLVF